MVVKLAPWGAAHCNSLRPGRRCLVRTESSTAVRGIARAPLAARPWVAGGINAPNAPYRCGYRWRSNCMHAESRRQVLIVMSQSSQAGREAARVGIDLRDDSFSHGHTYVSFGRVTGQPSSC